MDEILAAKLRLVRSKCVRLTALREALELLATWEFEIEEHGCPRLKGDVILAGLVPPSIEGHLTDEMKTILETVPSFLNTIREGMLACVERGLDAEVCERIKG